MLKHHVYISKYLCFCKTLLKSAAAGILGGMHKEGQLGSCVSLRMEVRMQDTSSLHVFELITFVFVFVFVCALLVFVMHKYKKASRAFVSVRQNGGQYARHL